MKICTKIFQKFFEARGVNISKTQCVNLAGFWQVFFKQKLLETFGKIAPLATPFLRLFLICSIWYDFAKDFIRCAINLLHLRFLHA